MDIHFYPRKNDATNKSGRCPIYCTITVNSLKCVPFSTGIKIIAQNWDRHKKTTHDEFSDTVRQELIRVENSLRRIKIDLEERSQPITAEIIKSIYYSLKKEQKQTKTPKNLLTLESIYNKLTAKKMAEGASDSTKKHDYYLYKSFLNYVESTGLENVTPIQVSLELIEGYIENYKFSKNYLRQSIAFLEKALDSAMKKGIIANNVVKDYIDKPKGGKSKCSDEIGLEMEELDIIKSYLANGQMLEREKKAIHVFLFMCGTSLDFCDYNTLQSRHIEEIGTKKIIRIKRQKTDRYDTSRICYHNAIIKPIALEILDFYGGKVENLPRFKYSHDLDFVLQTIALRIGIEKILTTKRARKTFANISINYEMHTDEQTAYQMGHVDTKQLRNYRRYNDKILDNLIN